MAQDGVVLICPVFFRVVVDGHKILYRCKGLLSLSLLGFASGKVYKTHCIFGSPSYILLLALDMDI